MQIVIPLQWAVDLHQKYKSKYLNFMFAAIGLWFFVHAVKFGFNTYDTGWPTEYKASGTVGYVPDTKSFWIKYNGEDLFYNCGDECFTDGTEVKSGEGVDFKYYKGRIRGDINVTETTLHPN